MRSSSIFFFTRKMTSKAFGRTTPTKLLCLSPKIKCTREITSLTGTRSPRDFLAQSYNCSPYRGMTLQAKIVTTSIVASVDPDPDPDHYAYPWQISLDIAAASEDASDEDGPEFIGSAVEKVAEGSATFDSLAVKWNKPLKKEGELVVIEATLRVGSGKSESKETGI